MKSQSDPLVRTDTANAKLTTWLVIVSLALLLLGNNKMTSGWYIAGTGASDALNNVGLALLIAAITQYYTDFRVRSKFYMDVSDHIVANETLRESGIAEFFADSKACSPQKLIELADQLDVGVTYSDRLLKDNIGIIKKRADTLKIRVFCVEETEQARKFLALSTGQSVGDIETEQRKLSAMIKELREAGVDVSEYRQPTLPHYSFFVLDETYFFLTMSTFASRRSSVPMFQADASSPLASLIREDRDHVIAMSNKVKA